MEQETLEVTKKKGNPNFGAKKLKDADLNEINEVDRLYHFVLTQSWEQYKPVDMEGGKMNSAPYPPILQIPSEGITLDDETGKSRRWRCLKGVDSIWSDEQGEVEPNGFDDYEEIIFAHGQLKVRGYEINKIAALKNFDGFQGKKHKKANSTPLYRLIDLDVDLNKSIDDLDLEYDALKIAKESSDEEMMAFAYVLGINLDVSVKQIRRDFIMKAKSNPKYFVKYFVDPKNEISYIFAKGFKDGIISESAVEGKLVWTESRKVIMDAPKGTDIVQTLAKLVMQNDETSVKVLEQLKKM